MGEAKRRQQLDPDYGKPKLIEGVLETCKKLFRPRGRSGEIALRWKILDFYRTALENDTPGVTIFFCSQGLADTENLPGFTGSPVLIGSEFMTMETLVDVQIPKLPIEDIRHLAPETDFTSNRITVIRLCLGTNSSDMLNVIPVEVIQQELNSEEIE